MDDMTLILERRQYLVNRSSDSFHFNRLAYVFERSTGDRNGYTAQVAGSISIEIAGKLTCQVQVGLVIAWVGVRIQDDNLIDRFATCQQQIKAERHHLRLTSQDCEKGCV